MGTTITKQILFLANSRKYGGRCVVGKEMLPDRTLAWVRPVSDYGKGEVMPDEMCFSDESMPQLLDVIEVSLLEAKPLPYQPENWLLAPEPWKKLRAADKANIERWLDDPSPLWENGHHTVQGTNDRFPYDAAQTLADSARFIEVPSLDITVSDRKDDEGAIKRQLRGSFAHAGDVYDLRITDIGFEERYSEVRPGKLRLGKAYLTVTIGEPYEPPSGGGLYHYKLIAAIIEV